MDEGTAGIEGDFGVGAGDSAGTGTEGRAWSGVEDAVSSKFVAGVGIETNERTDVGHWTITGVKRNWGWGRGYF